MGSRLTMERTGRRADPLAGPAPSAATARQQAAARWLPAHVRELDLARARQLGQDLAALGDRGGEELARTVEALGALGDDVPTACLARLQAAVVAGFVEAQTVRHAREQARACAAHQRELAALRGSLRQLRREALHDPLTGLPNRRYLARWLRALTGDGPTRVGVCVVDLDNFKHVNDSLGHDAGDDLLRVVSRRLETCVGRAGRLLVRYGGDEFVILVAHPGGEADVVALAELALAQVPEPVVLAGRTVRITCSVGVAVVDVGSGEPLDVVRAADSALYRAKSGGKNRWAVRRPALAS
jgi:diguanylate cyclase (GGDEF)-like protein